MRRWSKTVHAPVPHKGNLISEIHGHGGEIDIQYANEARARQIVQYAAGVARLPFWRRYSSSIMAEEWETLAETISFRSSLFYFKRPCMRSKHWTPWLHIPPLLILDTVINSRAILLDNTTPRFAASPLSGTVRKRGNKAYSGSCCKLEVSPREALRQNYPSALRHGSSLIIGSACCSD